MNDKRTDRGVRRWVLRTHALTTDDICQPTEEQLTDKCTDGSSNLDTEILVSSELLVVAVDIAEHGRGNVDGENVVAVEGWVTRLGKLC